MNERAPREVTAGEPARPLYEGLWGLLARWFLVPRDPPAVPPGGADAARSFRPAWAHYTLLRIRYLIGMLLPAIAGLLGLTVAAATVEAWQLALLLVLAPLAAAGLLGGWILLRLRFDTTWYVMTDRALRVRRGILTIQEQTVTYENIQNVRVRRGPLQRWLGIGDVWVETAAAGRADPQKGSTSGHRIVIEGVDDPVGIRDRIVEWMKASRHRGLGDDSAVGAEESGAPDSAEGRPTEGGGWSPAHTEVLREIHHEVVRLSGSAPR